MKKFVWTIFIITVMSVSPLRARENHQSGAFDQEKLGKVIFPVSCTLIAQEQFNQAVAMLHSFWYDEAEKTFRQSNSYRSSLRPGSTARAAYAVAHFYQIG